MSHISQNTAEIGTVDESVLQETLELVIAATQGASLTTEIDQYYGGRLKVDAALRCPQLKRGLGINFRNVDALTFIGDGFGYQEKYDEMQQLIVQTYQVVALQRALPQLGYAVQQPEAIDSARVPTLRLQAVAA